MTTTTDETWVTALQSAGTDDADDVIIPGPNDTWLVVGWRDDGSIFIQTIGTQFSVDEVIHERLPNTRDHKKANVKGQTTIRLAPKMWINR